MSSLLLHILLCTPAPRSSKSLFHFLYDTLVFLVHQPEEATALQRLPASALILKMIIYLSSVYLSLFTDPLSLCCFDFTRSFVYLISTSPFFLVFFVPAPNLHLTSKTFNCLQMSAPCLPLTRVFLSLTHQITQWTLLHTPWKLGETQVWSWKCDCSVYSPCPSRFSTGFLQNWDFLADLCWLYIQCERMYFQFQYFNLWKKWYEKLCKDNTFGILQCTLWPKLVVFHWDEDTFAHEHVP